MADLGLKINYGLSTALPSKAKGNIYVCLDNKRVYADLPDVSAENTVTRIELGDIGNLVGQINTLSTSLSSLSGSLAKIATTGSYNDLVDLPHISKQGYTNNETWYFPLGKFAIDNAGNYGNFTFTGRFGGWSQGNAATYSIMLMNRSDYTAENITSTVSASGQVTNALSICDLVIIKNSDLSNTLYIKCKGYFCFDFAYTEYQHSIIYDGTYTTTEPSDIVWQLSTAPKTELSTSGVFTATGGVPASTITGTFTKDKISDLPAVANSGSYNDLTNKPSIPVAADKGYNGYLSAGGDGVTEVGQYFDFHVKDSDGNLSENDYDTRLKAQGQNKNVVNLPTNGGTLVVGDQEYIIQVSSSAPAAGTPDNVITFVVEG